jgi:hypothetical protein
MLPAIRNPHVIGMPVKKRGGNNPPPASILDAHASMVISLWRGAASVHVV